MTGVDSSQGPFEAHLELLECFLARREAIVERIHDVLNARRQPVESLQDGARLSRELADCFFALPGLAPAHPRLRAHLDEAHWASGFRPRALPGLHNDLVDPAELIVRGFHLWQQTRWPGRAGRIRYAHTIFNLFMLRRLTLLTMRLWDAGPGGAGDRLARVQGVLDRLWAGSAADQPVFVRDARWLIPLAQSPATDDLGAYFLVAETIATTLPGEDRMAIHGAGACMAGGHLRSQIHYYAGKKAVPLDEERLVQGLRNTNALDYALLIQDLLPLLEAYDEARLQTDDRRRLALADAICQGLSPDPELFVNRVDLLGAYSMIEHLFITSGRDGDADYTPMGRRHVELFEQYAARIGRVARPLFDDCARFRPVPGAYSPYGVLYGFSSDLLEHMALKSLQPDAVTRFALEDVFTGGDAGGEKLAWVNGWRQLPHIARDVQRRFAYPQPFAEDVFARIERALHRRASAGDAGAAGHTGRLYILPADERPRDPAAPPPGLPVQYIASSDRRLVAAHAAEWCEEALIMSDRREGRCLISYRTPGGWVAISKSLLSEVLGAGRDANIAGLPREAAGVLTLMCRGLVGARTDLPVSRG